MAIVRYWIGALLIDLSKSCSCSINYELSNQQLSYWAGWHKVWTMEQCKVVFSRLAPEPCRPPYLIVFTFKGVTLTFHKGKSLSTCSHNEIWGDFTQAAWHNLIRSNSFFYGKRSPFCGVKVAHFFYFLPSLKAIF